MDRPVMPNFMYLPDLGEAHRKAQSLHAFQRYCLPERTAVFGQQRCDVWLNSSVILVQAAIQAVHSRWAIGQRRIKRRQLRHKIEMLAAALAGVYLATPKNVLHLVAAMV